MRVHAAREFGGASWFACELIGQLQHGGGVKNIGNPSASGHLDQLDVRRKGVAFSLRVAQHGNLHEWSEAVSATSPIKMHSAPTIVASLLHWSTPIRRLSPRRDRIAPTMRSGRLRGLGLGGTIWDWSELVLKWRCPGEGSLFEFGDGTGGRCTPRRRESDPSASLPPECRRRG